MNPNRKGLSKATRFAILTRDNFRCRYCGRSADQVELEIDHVVPVAAGGTNDPSNLVTSCSHCNNGKRDRADVIHPDERERRRIERMEEFTEYLLDCPYEFVTCDPYVTAIYGEPVL